MNATVEKQTHEFQTEVTQLLKLMIHSLYSNQEIFLRELISNASDACDKLRFSALSNEAMLEEDPDLKVRISFNKKKKTLTISDNGIGMNAEQIVEHLGTIAKSGTREFFQGLTGDQAKDSQMIGQFGVGFYSSFIVADNVQVISRAAGDAPDQAVIWESAGEGSYTLEGTTKDSRGTEITLHLNKEAVKEFLEDFRIRNIVTTYSDHIGFPIEMQVTEGDNKGEWEPVNKASALWTLQKKEISDDEYKEFYKHVAHDFEEPQEWIHNHVEGKQSYISLFYIPKRAPFDLMERDKRHGIKLYVKRVFIMDDAEHLMPSWLRFVRGLVDSDDLPLNVSREILQSNKLIDTIRSASVKKVLTMLEKMAKKKPEDYSEFWKQFGTVLKEGPVEDFANRDRIMKLFRYHSTHEDGTEPAVTLEDYIGRMKDKQDKIYYITAESFAAAKSSPHLGVFREKGIEVLLMHERVDEWMMSQVSEFDGKTMQSITSSELDLGELADKKEKKAQEKVAEENKGLVERMKAVLGDDVNEVKVSNRLTDAPSCVVQGAYDMSMHMQKILKTAGHEMPSSKPTLEINADHALVKRLNDEQDDNRFAEWTRILYEQAVLAEGGELPDPYAFVSRLNNMLAELSGAGESGRIIT
jgi:molecular chaperone HtpG